MFLLIWQIFKCPEAQAINIVYTSNGQYAKTPNIWMDDISSTLDIQVNISPKSKKFCLPASIWTNMDIMLIFIPRIEC